MRKIEIKMIEMIKAAKTGSCGGNTFVDIIPVTGHLGNDPDRYCAEITLYNSVIARLFINRTNGKVERHTFDHNGFRSNTTKSRLNAIAQGFGLDSITQKNFRWYRNGVEI